MSSVMVKAMMRRHEAPEVIPLRKGVETIPGERELSDETSDAIQRSCVKQERAFTNKRARGAYAPRNISNLLGFEAGWKLARD